MIAASLPRLYAPVLEDFERYEVMLQAALVGSSPTIHELTQHVARFRGKQLRPALVFLAARAVGATVLTEHVHAAVAIELIHTATLVHDDILDHAESRRSLETVNAAWGTEAAVLLGDWLFATAYGVAAGIEEPYLARRLAEATRAVCQGEVEQLHHRGNAALDRETYFRIITGKTATLYRVAAELGAHYGNGTPTEVEALATYGLKLGIAFQIADDILDLEGRPEETGKPVGADLEAGTVTLPILIARERGSAETRRGLAAALARGDRESRAEVLALLAPLDACAAARREGQTLVQGAREALTCLPDSAARSALEGIADYVLARRF